MSKQKQAPNVFHVSLLSHFFLLVATLAVCFFVVQYLFSSSIRYFLQHDLVVLVPVVLFLFGVAGLIASIAARSVAYPLVHIINLLEEEARSGATGRIAYRSNIEEINELVQALEASRKSFTAIQEAPAAVIVCDRDGVIRYVNSRAKSLFRWPVNLNENFLDQFSSEADAALIQTVTGNGQVLNAFRIRGIDSTLWWFFPLRNRHTSEAGFIGIGVNMRQ
ncbi:MAG: PAS domain-containing protein [Chlorobi bacterium]|nr:PAS domain-containing protein [Chlorobiota bacterium]